MSINKQTFPEMRKHDRVEVSRSITATDRQTGVEIGQLVNFRSLSFESETENEGPIHIGVESLWGHASDDNSCHWTGFFIIDISDHDLERLHALTG
jgi:hypothetical protein